jgi:hypothetical protein
MRTVIYRCPEATLRNERAEQRLVKSIVSATWSAAQHVPADNFLEKKFHDCDREAQ